MYTYTSSCIKKHCCKVAFLRLVSATLSVLGNSAQPQPRRFRMSRKPSPKAKAFAQAMFNALATANAVARAEALGKAPYVASSPDAYIAFGIALCDAPEMPLEIFHGNSHNNRRAWCVANAPIVNTEKVCEKVGARCDNTLRSRIDQWVTMGVLPEHVSYMRAFALSSATDNERGVFVFRVANK